MALTSVKDAGYVTDATARDTVTSPFSIPHHGAGKALFHIIASMAEFERELIRERVKAGLDNAKRKGKRLGRKPLPPVVRAKIIDAHINNPNLSITGLSKATKQTSGSVYKTLVNYRAGKLDKDGFEYANPLV